jgi:hypothetical protein
MSIDGSVPTTVIRRGYLEGGEAEALKIAAECMSGISDEEILAVARCEARIVGNTREGNIRLEWTNAEGK